MVYLNMVQEAQNVVSFTANLFEGEQEVPEGIISLYSIDGGRRGMPRPLLVYRVSIFFSFD